MVIDDEVSQQPPTAVLLGYGSETPDPVLTTSFREKTQKLNGESHESKLGAGPQEIGHWETAEGTAEGTASYST